tara:strand:- start:92 stop:877 length:786 start_codon:yes stop_codon:yes gene_type:complete
MSTQKIKNYFISSKYKNKKVQYGFFSKNGGYSKNNYSSLNCSISSGDDIEIVKKNIEIAKKNLRLENKKIKFLKQTHSSNVELITKKNFNDILEADGSITKETDIALAIMTADCAPIFIYDTNHSFICSLHSGWRGSLKNIIKNAIIKITKLKVDNKNLIALIGPCLGEKNFEVNLDIKNNFIKESSNYKKFFHISSNQSKYFFDMRGLLNYQLNSCGINNISNVIFDTYQKKDTFFSHRYSSHNSTLPTGRMINLIGFAN